MWVQKPENCARFVIQFKAIKCFTRSGMQSWLSSGLEIYLEKNHFYGTYTSGCGFGYPITKSGMFLHDDVFYI